MRNVHLIGEGVWVNCTGQVKSVSVDQFSSSEGLVQHACRKKINLAPSYEHYYVYSRMQYSARIEHAIREKLGTWHNMLTEL